MKENKTNKSPLGQYMNYPIYIAALVLIANITMFIIDIRAGLFMLIFTIAATTFAGWIWYSRRQFVLKSMIQFAEDFNGIQKVVLENLKLPYSIVDDDGQIYWYNEAFGRLIEKQVKKKYIQDVFPQVLEEGLIEGEEHKKTIHLTFEDKHFSMDMERMMLPDNLEGEGEWDNGLKLTAKALESKPNLIAVYLFDETETIQYQIQLKEQKLVVAQAYLDNYYEALETIEEVRRSLLVALLDRKINKYFSNFGAIVKKIEKDKYFIVLKEKDVDALRNDKFSVLEDVKSVNIGNDLPVTLSVGIGMGNDTFADNNDLSRSAIDMALARGGDQVVLKDGGKTSYYGGKSQQTEKNTRVKARVKAHALRELAETKDRVLVMGHKNSDIDSFGASVGIYRAMTALNKSTYIVFNEIASSVRGMAERFENSPDYPENFIISGERALEMITDDTMLIVVDVNRRSITECAALLDKVKTIVVLDHHRQTTESIENAVLSYVEPYASSTCELVAEILQYISDNIKIKQIEADAMYGGIMIDTNNFTNQTGVRTFEAAAFLRRNGADITRVRKMFRDTWADSIAKAETIRNAEIFMDGIAISVCEGKDCEKPTIIGAQGANDLLDIIGIKASIVLTKYQDVIYLSARSIDEVNVQVLMERLGGGGHLTTAGAQLTGCTMKEAVTMVKDTIANMIEEGAI